jgi:alpha-glucosidase
MLLLLSIACKPGGSYELDGGAVLEVDNSGGFELVVDGQETFALAAPPELRSFEDQVEMSLGIWKFERADETSIQLSRLSGVEEIEGGWALIYTDQDETVEARLSVRGGPESTRFELVPDTASSSLAVAARCDETGSFHGFGEQYHQTDQRGEAFPLWVSEQGIGRDGSAWQLTGDAHTTYFPMPWYLDARGFGVLLDTDYRVQVDLCSSDPDRAWLEAVGDSQLDWMVFHGPSPKEVLTQLGDEIGRPSGPPDWAYGTWMCMQGGEAAVRERLEAIEEAGIPATTLWVQDWTGRRQNPGGGYGVQYRWEADEEELYPGIAAFFEELHQRGYKVVGYVNPFVDPSLQHWDEMEEGGMLPLHPETGETYTFFGPRGDMTTADLSNPDTQEYIREHLRVAVDEVGLDGWMADFAEWLPHDAVLAEGDAASVHNVYPELWQSLTRDVMEELRPDGDWLMYGRSGWTGVHSQSQVHWVGDQEADWSDTDGLPTVVPAMLNLGLSGQPFVTHDIAGFSGGPSDKELYLRWTELGALSPYMRTHDGNERDENHRWDSDEETTAHFTRMALLHEALGPELIELAAEAEQTGAPIVRHLMLEHPEDLETWGLSDQYLLGSELLVAPVTVQGATSREVYLPEGRWFHVWTGEEHQGPAWITAQAPLGEPPLFSRGTDRNDLRSL